MERRDFNTYGSRRGNHEVMIRGTFANIRLRNQLAPGTEGGVTVKLPEGEQTSIYEASRQYLAEGTPLLVLGGKEYGSGSSRDWAAKGTALLGVRAVLVESFERIHRSNLIGMGVLPLQYRPGESAASLGLTGHEVFDVTGIEAMNDGAGAAGGHGPRRWPRVPRRGPDRHARRGRVLPARRDHAVRAALAAGPRLSGWPRYPAVAGCGVPAGRRDRPARAGDRAAGRRHHRARLQPAGRDHQPAAAVP